MRWFAAVAALMMLASPALAAEDCGLHKVASFDLSFDESGRVAVPVTINGEPLRMLVDTGGFGTTLTEAAVKKLGLEKHAVTSVQMAYYGGIPLKQFVWAPKVDLGGLKADKLAMPVMPDYMMSRDDDGTLSPDILAAFDVDFDFANGKLNLFSQQHCEGQVVYWMKDPVAAVIPFRINEGNQITTFLDLDGKHVKATVDTGAHRTTLSLEKAESLFDFEDNDPLLKKVDGDTSLKEYRYPFKTLSLEGIAVSKPDIALVPDSESKSPGLMLLGMNVLRNLHVYVAYKERKLYVTPATAH